MIVKKFLHSCLLLEKDGKRLLIDPGLFSFIEKRITPNDIGHVDAILISHKHQDHFDPEILAQFLAMGPTAIHTIHEIGEELTKSQLPYERLAPGDKKIIAGFRVDIYHAEHGALPIGIPDNAAFFIEGLLHPGDSFHPEGLSSCETLALPISAPWLTLNQALEMVDRLKPKQVIPIHDGIVKDFMLQRMYDRMLRPLLDQKEIAFQPLGLGDTLNL